tara:strand:+ start:1281 stop:2093 length:813 start_codon:yes stop_codon:yes gene_type:complete
MSNTEVSTTQPVTINTTNETAQLKISPDRAVQARDIYYECCKQLAQHISENGDTFGEVNFEELIKSIPEPTFEVDENLSKTKKKSKSKPKAKPFTLENWKECDDKDVLKKCFKSKDLKDILSANSLPISGNKDELLARVWGITHPDEAPELPKKKPRGKKKASKKEKVDTTSVEDSDDDVSQASDGTSVQDVQEMLDNRTPIYIDNTTHEVTKKSKDSTEYKLVKQKGWIFKESDEDFEFAGLLQMVEGKSKMVSCEAPEELMELFGEEE